MAPADSLFMKTFLKTLARSTDSQDLIEYALLAGLISLTALFAVINVGTGVNGVWTRVDSQVQTIP